MLESRKEISAEVYEDEIESSIEYIFQPTPRPLRRRLYFAWESRDSRCREGRAEVRAIDDAIFSHAYRTKTDSVFQALKAAIISGQLQPGDWIRNSDWAERLGVSPIPVREALRRLEAQGLVEIGAHKGARVTAQTEAHIEETYLIRMALESLAARLALEDIPDAAYKKLVKEVETRTATLEKQIAARSTIGAVRANYDIHMALYRASGRPRLVSMIENLWATYPFGAPSWPDERWEAMLSEHASFLETLRRRDPDLMARFTEEHIRKARKLNVRLTPRVEALAAGD